MNRRTFVQSTTSALGVVAFGTSATQDWDRLRVDGGRLYTAHISRLSAVYQFNVRTFFRSILQYADYRHSPDLYSFEIDREDRRLFNQHLFSYKINPWTVLFLGYSDGWRGSDTFDFEQRDRTFFVKVGYSWAL